MSELFNTEALQALDDKSELKEMPRVASPALWLILTSLLMICGLALFWCIFGKLNYTVNATGVGYYHLRQLTLYDFLRHQPIHHY